MIRVAITGNIGCGKSYICAAFEKHGIPVFHSDDEAKRLYFLPEIRQKITERFGNESYLPDGNINRVFMAETLFSDGDALAFVEGLLYPALDKVFNEWIEKQSATYVLYESAIIFEKKMEDKFDKIIVVTASEDVRIKRVIQRDKCSEQEVRNRISLQLPQEEKKKKADFVITHDGDDDFDEKVAEIDLALRKLPV